MRINVMRHEAPVFIIVMSIGVINKRWRDLEVGNVARELYREMKVMASALGANRFGAESAA